MSMRVTEEQVVRLLAMRDAIELVERSFRELAGGTAVNHPRRRVVLPSGSILHYMAAGNAEYFGIKAYSTNAKTGAHFEFLLYRSSDGMPLATFEANQLGQIRTGAASGAATKQLAREDANVLGLIGSGFQAETQVAAIACVRELREVRVWSRKAEKRTAFAARCAERFGLKVRAVETAREAVEGAGIVVTATSSKEPVLESGWLSPGTHVNAMGSNWLTRRELPGDLVLERAEVVAVDSLEDAALESGDLAIPGALGRAVELSAARRSSPEQITVFKSHGLAIQDVVSAGFVYERLLAEQDSPVPVG